MEGQGEGAIGGSLLLIVGDVLELAVAGRVKLMETLFSPSADFALPGAPPAASWNCWSVCLSLSLSFPFELSSKFEFAPEFEFEFEFELELEVELECSLGLVHLSRGRKQTGRREHNNARTSCSAARERTCRGQVH